ncbi:MAG: replicative DNA helicase [Candidatus Moraniibacteriota bacterium]|nr:MAG: replicative DNA helicase [Candidatus Moranbacteria bacterium]
MTHDQTQDLRVPPHAEQAEKTVLGALMVDKEAITKIADMIRVGDFYTAAHNTIYDVMLQLYENNDPIDVLSISNKLEEQKKIDDVGGAPYLATLVSSVTSASNITYYARIIQKKAILRKLIATAAEINELGYKESEDIETILDEAEQKIFGISQKSLKQEFTPIKTILGDAFDRLDELHKNKGEMRGVPTGFLDLDDLLAGLQKSDLIILAARPSVGKTSLALDIARQVGTIAKIPVGIFSLEMSADQLVDRMIAAEANLDLWRLRTGNLKESDFTEISETMGTLSEAPIFIDDTSSANIMEMRTMARRLQAEHDLGLIIIDYLQLMEGRSNENRVQEISEISRGLKMLAKELNIPILALSQLSRAVESRNDQRPKLSDLRESGSIEQDADVVMFIYREDRVNPDTENKGVAEIIVAKHRNGPVGTKQLYFHEESASYKNLERVRTQESSPKTDN